MSHERWRFLFLHPAGSCLQCGHPHRWASRVQRAGQLLTVRTVWRAVPGENRARGAVLRRYDSWWHRSVTGAYIMWGPCLRYKLAGRGQCRAKTCCTSRQSPSSGTSTYYSWTSISSWICRRLTQHTPSRRVRDIVHVHRVRTHSVEGQDAIPKLAMAGSYHTDLHVVCQAGFPLPNRPATRVCATLWGIYSVWDVCSNASEVVRCSWPASCSWPATCSRPG